MEEINRECCWILGKGIFLQSCSPLPLYLIIVELSLFPSIFLLLSLNICIKTSYSFGHIAAILLKEPLIVTTKNMNKRNRQQQHQQQQHQHNQQQSSLICRFTSSAPEVRALLKEFTNLGKPSSSFSLSQAISKRASLYLYSFIPLSL